MFSPFQLSKMLFPIFQLEFFNFSYNTYPESYCWSGTKKGINNHDDDDDDYNSSNSTNNLGPNYKKILRLSYDVIITYDNRKSNLR